MPNLVTSKPMLNSPSVLKTILFSGFLAGTLDILAAMIIYSFVMRKATPLQILQGIAGGVFGKEAFSGGTGMALIGLLFHFIIAGCFAIGYFIVFPYIPFLRKQKIISGFLYGIFVWFIMNIIVLPLSNANQPSFKWDSVLRSAGILMFCIGLPISLITHRYYTLKNTSTLNHQSMSFKL